MCVCFWNIFRVCVDGANLWTIYQVRMSTFGRGDKLSSSAGTCVHMHLSQNFGSGRAPPLMGRHGGGEAKEKDWSMELETYTHLGAIGAVHVIMTLGPLTLLLLCIV